MRRALFPVLALLAAAALAGCNQVYSEKPLFTSADEVGAPPLRPGVWTQPSAKCRFDERRPVQRWPKCGQWMLIRPGQILGFEEKEGKAAWTALDLVVASGDPRIIQLPAEEASPGRFAFAGARPVRLDPEGRIIAIETWPVQCGPPRKPVPAAPPSAADAPAASAQPSSAGGQSKPTAQSHVSEHPLPGLEVDGDNCIAREASVVRTAAASSKAWSESPTSYRWVRDTLP